MIEEVKLKIQNGEVKEAIQHLISDYKNTEYGNELISLSSRYLSNERGNRMNVISSELYDQFSNKIIIDLLNLIDEIKDKSIITEGINKENESSKKIMFCESNPLPERNLLSNVEIREIEEIIINGENKLELISKFGLSMLKFIRSIIRFRPQIIHFTAFSNEKGVHFHSKSDKSDFVSNNFFEKQLEIVYDQFECLFFNTFISEELAKKISNEKIFVIGFNGIVLSLGAIEFATGFYTALSYGKNYKEAFQVGYQTVLKGNYHEITSKLYAYYNGERIKQDDTI